MNLQPRQSESPSLRTLSHELSSATVALDAALRSDVAREERIREARAALETFQLVERTPDHFAVPRKVRRRVEWALSELERGNLELADADLRWAGGIFEKAVVEYYRRRYQD
jgi:hypothetical protein